MSTFRGRLATQLVRALRIKQRLTRLAEVESDPGAFMRRLKVLRRTDRRRPPAWMRLRWEVERVDVAGFDLLVMSQRGTRGRRVLLYLHGGGYLFGPFGTEWAAMRKVAGASTCDYAMLLYPRSPEHDAAAALRVARDAYRVLSDRYGAGRVLPIGTSAGGGLAIALLAGLRDDDQELPPCVVLLSPGVDMTLDAPVGRLEESDVLLSTAHVRSAGRVHAGVLGPDHPTVSPLFGDLGGLPTMYVFVGGAELLRPSIEAFVRKAVASGTDARLILGDDEQHTWPISPTPEGRQARTQIVAIVASC